MKIGGKATTKALVFVMLFLGAMVCVPTVHVKQEEYKPLDKTSEDAFLQGYINWHRGIEAIFMERPFSSFVTQKQLMKMDKMDLKYLVPFGPKALPYLIVVMQYDQWVDNRDDPRRGGAITKISKFKPHIVVLSRMRGLLWTTEEFPQWVERDVVPNRCKIWLRWLLEGERRTPKWFAERYEKWLTLRKQGETNEAKEAKEWLDLLRGYWKGGRYEPTAYQKLLDIGIAAIPLWLEKLRTEGNPELRHAIMQALSALTEGEIEPTMSVQECLNWWQANKERWTVPFPKSKREFLEWLEKKCWEEPRLSIGPVLTISRLEDEGAIDTLIRFLKHPSPLVRAISLQQIQKLFGEQLPKEYALGVGADEWESYGDLVDLGKDTLVKKRMRAMEERVKDLKEAEKVAEELFDWWERNRGKVTIYWRRAWEGLW